LFFPNVCADPMRHWPQNPSKLILEGKKSGFLFERGKRCIPKVHDAAPASVLPVTSASVVLKLVSSGAATFARQKPLVLRENYDRAAGLTGGEAPLVRPAVRPINTI
jgi:hypothetical protein